MNGDLWAGIVIGVLFAPAVWILVERIRWPWSVKRRLLLLKRGWPFRRRKGIDLETAVAMMREKDWAPRRPQEPVPLHPKDFAAYQREMGVELPSPSKSEAPPIEYRPLDLAPVPGLRIDGKPVVVSDELASMGVGTIRVERDPLPVNPTCAACGDDATRHRSDCSTASDCGEHVEHRCSIAPGDKPRLCCCCFWSNQGAEQLAEQVLARRRAMAPVPDDPCDANWSHEIWAEFSGTRTRLWAGLWDPGMAFTPGAFIPDDAKVQLVDVRTGIVVSEKTAGEMRKPSPLLKRTRYEPEPVE